MWWWARAAEDTCEWEHKCQEALDREDSWTRTTMRAAAARRVDDAWSRRMASDGDERQETGEKGLQSRKRGSQAACDAQLKGRSARRTMMSRHRTDAPTDSTNSSSVDPPHSARKNRGC
jgi:hypothetical protein